MTVVWPKVGQPIWAIFNALSRPPSMGGLSRISQQEILAWQQNHDTRLTPWELEMIDVFDRIAMETSSQQDAKK